MLSDGTSDANTTVRITARLDDGIAPGTIYVPSYYDGGAILALLPLDALAPDGDPTPPAVRLHALQSAWPCAICEFTAPTRISGAIPSL